MNRKDKIWINYMTFFNKYWGCHQLPQRSFFVKGYQLPICARCCGILLGYIISFILIILNIHFNPLFSLIIILPMGLDGIIQFLTSYESNNIKRIITGLISGIGFIQLLFYILKHLYLLFV